RRLGARYRAVPVAVRLDDGAQLGTPAQLREQARAVALDRRYVHARERAPAAHARAPCARAAGSAAITSVAMTPSTAPTRRAASRPACACSHTPAAAAVNGSSPCARIAATIPVSTSPVPAVASAGLPPGLT